MTRRLSSWLLLFGLIYGGIVPADTVPAADPTAVLDGLRRGGGGVGGGPLANKLDVQVIDGQNGAPIPGAWVRLGANGPSALTDPSGRAAFTPITGPVDVTATKTGFGPTTLGGVQSRAVVLPLAGAAAPRGSLRELSREIQVGRLLPSSIQGVAWRSNPAGSFALVGAQAQQALAALAQVNARFLAPAGMSTVSLRAGGLFARLPGLDQEIQFGGGRMNGVAAPGMRFLAARAPNAAAWSMRALLRGPAGAALGRWQLPAAPPFGFGAPLAFAAVPAALAGANPALLRWTLPAAPVAAGGAGGLISLAIEMSGGRTWNVLLPAGRSSFQMPAIPGGRPAAYRWTVANHSLPGLNPAAWRLGDLEPAASSFAPAKVVGAAGAYDARFWPSLLGSLYSMPENGAWLLERKPGERAFLTF
ncbi:MAG: carboxypeptidase regulatory-like domain-containing protein [Planctomycetes bacterium]|nr:carboxypeptidase regulatory-like domain-containing protein [Planctomycetota bacterium]